MHDSGASRREIAEAYLEEAYLEEAYLELGVWKLNRE
jgi:hypothetical protein